MTSPVSKIYNVRVHLSPEESRDYLVSAQTAAGAKRDILKMIGVIAEASPATAEQLYHAGANGVKVIGRDDLKNAAPEVLHGFHGVTRDDVCNTDGSVPPVSSENNIAWVNNAATENAHVN